MPIKNNYKSFTKRYLVGDSQTVIANNSTIFNTITSCLNYIQSNNKIGKIYVMPKYDGQPWTEQINLVGDFDWSDLEIEFDKKAKLTPVAITNGTGTISVASNTPKTVVGIGTLFTQECKPGQYINIGGFGGTYEIASIESDTSLTLATEHFNNFSPFGSSGNSNLVGNSDFNSGNFERFINGMTIKWNNNIYTVAGYFSTGTENLSVSPNLASTGVYPIIIHDRSFSIIKPVINIGMGGGYYYGLYRINEPINLLKGKSSEEYNKYKYITNIGSIQALYSATDDGYGTRFRDLTPGTDIFYVEPSKIFGGGSPSSNNTFGISSITNDSGNNAAVLGINSPYSTQNYCPYEFVGGNYFRRFSGVTIGPSYSSNTKFLVGSHNSIVDITSFGETDNRKIGVGNYKYRAAGSTHFYSPPPRPEIYKYYEATAIIKRYYRNIKIKANIINPSNISGVPALKIYCADVNFEGNINGILNYSAVVAKNANIDFKGNIENCGGEGVYGGAGNIQYTKFNIDSIKNCTATRGGGIYAQGSIINVDFINECKAISQSSVGEVPAFGGGIYSNNSSIQINMIDSCNSTTTLAAGTCGGGGIFLNSESSLKCNSISNCYTMYYNYASNSYSGNAIGYSNSNVIFMYVNDFGGNGSYGQTVANFLSDGSGNNTTSGFGVIRNGSSFSSDITDIANNMPLQYL